MGDHLDELRRIENARFEIMLELVVVPAAVALVAHLGDYAILGLGLHEKLALLERVGKRLLREYGKAAAHRVHERREVREVGRHHGHGVDLALHLVEHLAEVREARKSRILLERGAALPAFKISIAKSRNLHKTGLLELIDVVPCLLADAHARKAHLVASTERAYRWRGESRPADDVRKGARCERRLQKRPSGKAVHHDLLWTNHLLFSLILPFQAIRAKCKIIHWTFS